MRLSFQFLTIAATLALCSGSFSDKIKHVIILMLENRSFDHMLGFLKKSNPNVNGCLPDQSGCSNHVDPLDSSSTSYTVDDTAVYVQASPHHSITSTTQQIYGYMTDSVPSDAIPTMDGFIASYADEFGNNLTAAASIMKCFAPEHISVIANLSMEFGVFDGWFSSVPGPTMVNRAYAASATSHGMGTNDEVTIAKGLPQKTMFRQLQEMGLDYAVYYQDVPSVLQFKDMRHRDARPRYHAISELYTDVATGNIPEFVWVEPAYFSTSRQAATDQHPDHDVSLGEQLIKDIYDSIRASSIWNDTLFMITYDEHGGFFDHVPPPANVPSPDGIDSVDPPFDFTRLGVRIPTVAISPWIKKGSVFHASEDPSAGQYEHSSIAATVVHKLFPPARGYPPPEYLTERDAWAKTFERIVDDSELRTDCLVSAPSVFSHQKHFPNLIPKQDGSQLLTDLQRELIALVGSLATNSPNHPDTTNWTEEMGGKYCEQKVSEFLSSESE